MTMSMSRVGTGCMCVVPCLTTRANPMPVCCLVFIHYIPLDTCRTERRLRLRVQYYFDCFCGKCLAEESDNSMDYKRFKDLQNSLHSCIQSGICFIHTFLSTFCNHLLYLNIYKCNLK